MSNDAAPRHLDSAKVPSPRSTLPPDLREQKALKPILTHPDPMAIPRDRPLSFEIGPGRGDFMLHLAETRPDTHVIAVEIRLKRFIKLKTRIDRKALTNTTLFCGDALRVLKEPLNTYRFSDIHVQFPDPWPKRKHEKYRLVNRENLDFFLSFLEPHGRFHFTTDVEGYAHHVSSLFKERPDSTSLFQPSPIATSATVLDGEFTTFFADKWRQMGRTLYYQKYEIGTYQSLLKFP